MMEEHSLSEFRDKKYLTEVKIKNRWIEYGICAKNPNTMLIKGEYIGTSKEIRIDGDVQKPFAVEYNFWEKAE